MNTIWTPKKGVKAAFLTRETEKTHGVIRSLTNMPSGKEELQALNSNRLILAGTFGYPEIELAMGKQVHGTRITYAEAGGVYDDTDGLVTDRIGIALAVLVADCAALILADRVNKVAASVHAGWRGAADGIAERAVQKMIKLGAEPDLMDCYISPCISLARFEVGEEVAARFPDRYIDRSGIKPHVDLQGFLTSELERNGIPIDQISADGRCTFLSPEILHSYRRDGQSAGRMMASVVLV